MIEQAVILAGGKGTRLRPVTLEIPKPLVPVQGKEIITWQVRWFARAGVKRITVIIPGGWQEHFEVWKKKVESEFSEIELWVEHEPMGTLGALVHELSFSGEPILITNGDELKGLDLKALTTFHTARKIENPAYAATVALIEVPNPSDYGVAEMRGDHISKFHEKPDVPPSNLVSSGLYIIEPATLEAYKQHDRFLMFEKEYFPKQAEKGALGGCALKGPWFDCGTMKRWETAIEKWVEPTEIGS